MIAPKPAIPIPGLRPSHDDIAPQTGKLFGPALLIVAVNTHRKILSRLLQNLGHRRGAAQSHSHEQGTLRYRHKGISRHRVNMAASFGRLAH